VTLRHNDIQHKRHSAQQLTDCHYAECRILFNDMLSVIIPSIVMLSVVAPPCTAFQVLQSRVGSWPRAQTSPKAEKACQGQIQAYYENLLITAVKSSIVQARGVALLCGVRCTTEKALAIFLNNRQG
jgi:hypothetical protein